MRFGDRYDITSAQGCCTSGNWWRLKLPGRHLAQSLSPECVIMANGTKEDTNRPRRACCYLVGIRKASMDASNLWTPLAQDCVTCYFKTIGIYSPPLRPDKRRLGVFKLQSGIVLGDRSKRCKEFKVGFFVKRVYARTNRSESEWSLRNHVIQAFTFLIERVNTNFINISINSWSHS